MRLSQKTIFMVLSILLIRICVVSEVYGESKRKKIRQGNEHYNKEDYDASIEKFSEALADEPESDVINYDIGTAYYKKGDFVKAVEHLQKALLTEDEELKQKVFYNLGNAMYKAGIEHEDSDINGAVNALEQSLNSFESSLTLDKDDEDAKYNYDFVKKELERLRKMQEKENKKCDNPEDSKDGSEKNDDQSENNSDDKQDQDPRSQQQQEKKQEPQQQQEQKDEGNDPKSSEEDQGNNGSEEKDLSKEDEKNGDQGYNDNQGSHQEDPQQQQSGQKQSSGELSKKEAQMLIENYSQTEEPKGLLNVFQGQSTDRNVLKDW